MILKFDVNLKRSRLNEVRKRDEESTSECSATADRSVRVPESLALTEDKNPRLGELYVL